MSCANNITLYVHAKTPCACTHTLSFFLEVLGDLLSQLCPFVVITSDGLLARPAPYSFASQHSEQVAGVGLEGLENQHGLGLLNDKLPVLNPCGVSQPVYYRSETVVKRTEFTIQSSERENEMHLKSANARAVMTSYNLKSSYLISDFL